MRYQYDINKGIQKLKTKTALAVSGATLGITGLLMALLMPLAAHAAPVAVYNNIPSPTAGNYVSQAFEATQTSEFGGQVQFAGSATNPTVTVLMSSWGCQSGGWSTDNCVTTPGATFSEPITLNVYSVGSGNSVGALAASQTQTFNIPYRPSADSVNCTGDQAGEWYSATDHSCYNGFATPISFNLSGTLPNPAIISVAYNTSDYGYAPYGDVTACHSTSGGCGYDSLNVALTDPDSVPSIVAPSVGSDPQPNNVYAYAAGSYGYCDGAGDTGPTNVFRETAACWTGYQPMFKVTVNTLSKDDCKNNGWQTMTDANGKHFKNHGDCVSYFATNGKNTAAGQ